MKFKELIAKSLFLWLFVNFILIICLLLNLQINSHLLFHSIMYNLTSLFMLIVGL